jgi:8-oxo-(d)GTP phosphatase
VSEAIHAAGAVLWRPASGPPDGADVLLVHRPKYDDWSLPKGKRERGEHVLLTAVREVAEETSVRPVLGPRLPTIRYLVRGRSKQVDYWSATAGGAEAAPSHEIDAVAWHPLTHVVEALSYSRDAGVIASLEPRATVPLILVRHASAGDKKDWPGKDLMRPLDAEGTADALLLAGLLACFAPRARVLSSPAVRCVDSMRPYAQAFDGSVETEAALTVSRSSADRANRADSLQPLFRDLVAARQPAVLCLHRENLPAALAAACSALGGRPAKPNPSLAKGAFLVLHVAAGRLAAVECYEL